jgi:hypothetical protein
VPPPLVLVWAQLAEGWIVPPVVSCAIIPNHAANSRLSSSSSPELNNFRPLFELMFWMAAIMQLYLSIVAPFAQLPCPPMFGKKSSKLALENHLATSPFES